MTERERWFFRAGWREGVRLGFPATPGALDMQADTFLDAPNRRETNADALARVAPQEHDDE